MNEKTLFISPIVNEPLIKAASNLSKHGTLKISEEGLLYLDIDDDYIHRLFPLIGYNGVCKPDYFSTGIGAHISVIYPNESINPIYERHTKYDFEVMSLFKAQAEDAIYFALTVKAPALLETRSKNRLSPQLNLNGYTVDLHITIGKIEN